MLIQVSVTLLAVIAGILAGTTLAHAVAWIIWRKCCIVAALVLCASTAQAGGYGKSYCRSCYVAPVQKVVQPYNVQNIGNLNQFYSAAPYLQQPVTDAAYVAAQAEQIQYQLQAVNDQVAQLRQQSQSRQYVMVIPQAQIQAYVEQTETQGTEHCPTPGAQPGQPKFSNTQKPTLIQACASCHEAGKKAQKHFDMSGALDCDQQKAALMAVYSGRMPKGKRIQLTEDEMTAFSDDLGAWKAEQQTPPQDDPQPEPTPDNETAAPDENFSQALNKAGMKLAGQKIVVPKSPLTKRAR